MGHDDAPRVTRPSISRSFGVLSVGQILSRLLAFAVIVHLSRVLGPEGFGVIVFATSVLGYAALVVEMGFDTLGPLEVARGDIPVPALARAVVTLRLLLLAGGFGVVALFAWLAPVTTVTRIAILVYGVSLVANVFDLGWVFLGGQRVGPVAVAEIANQALQATGAFLLVREPEDLLRMPWVFVASRAITVAGLALAFRQRHGALGIGFDRPILRRLLPASVPLSGATTLGTLLTSFDMILMGLWRGTSAAGVYGAAYRVAWVPSMLASAYFTTLRPALARSSPAGFAAVAPVLRRSLRIAGATGIGIAAGGFVLADPLVGMLYGPQFAGAATPLRLLLVSVALLLVSRHYRALLQAFQRPGLDFRIMLAAGAVNVFLNLLLVPRLGLLGAAATSVTCETLILAASFLAARRVVGDATDVRALAGSLACAAIMAVAVHFATALPLLARMAFGAAVYSALVLAFRVVSIEDLREALRT